MVGDCKMKVVEADTLLFLSLLPFFASLCTVKEVAIEST